MPTYAYQCEACNAEIEVVQKMSDAPLTKCDSCGGKLQKRMFPVGIVFKGSGFYVNDYAKNGGSAVNPAAAPVKAPEPTPAATAPSTPAPPAAPSPAAVK